MRRTNTTPFLSKTLEEQIESFIFRLEEYNNKKANKQPNENYYFLRDFYTRFFTDRNKRASEIESSAYAEVKALANNQFAGPTLWDLCMDGRVLAILVNGASAGVGSSIRVPGGILREFVRGSDGKIKLIQTSNFARLLERAFQRYSSDTIYEVFDSHIGCAARKAEEWAHGYDAKDAGLYADVMHKKEMGEATSHFVKQKFGRKKRAITIQTSFDPHTGFIYMGLETASALSYAKQHGEVYTEDVLKALVKKGNILSAEEIAERKEVSKVFNAFLFDLDWEKNYVLSASTFWRNIDVMKKELLPLIQSLLIRAYPALKKKTDDAEKELHERAMLLLTNAYSGFLHNMYGNTKHSSTDIDASHYPYGVHREEGVKVSEGGYPPYEISMFVVFSLDKKNLPGNIELASSLVRSNRRDGRVVDRSGTYKDKDRFAMAPVPVVIQGIVRDAVTPEEWQKACEIEWNDIPANWDSMSTADFYTYLQGKGEISLALANGINRLREKMAVLYDPDNPTSAHLIEHYKAALPTIVGKNRRCYFIVPFMKLGFT